MRKLGAEQHDGTATVLFAAAGNLAAAAVLVPAAHCIDSACRRAALVNTTDEHNTANNPYSAGCNEHYR
jgi:hypothetical protein